MASGCDEVEHGVDTVISEPWVTLDPGFFGQDIVVLSLQVADDLLKASEPC